MIWARYLRHAGYGAPNTIWINIDETALPLYIGGRHGNVLRVPTRMGRAFTTRSTLAERRSNVTLLACVCTDKELQRYMPQILMPNTTGRKRLWRAAEAALTETPAVQIAQAHTGWITAELLIDALRAIKRVCNTHAPGKRIVLVMDGHSTHVTAPVLQRARALGMRPLIVPSKLTPQLQVLDVFVFAQFNLNLHRVHTAALLRSAAGKQDFLAWVVSTMRVIQDTFANVDGLAYFHALGQGPEAAPVRGELLRYAPPTWLPIPRPLTQQEFWFLLGRRLKGIHSSVFGRIPIVVAPPAAAPPARLRRACTKTTF